MILSILIFIFILGLLVFAHELGHFLVAKGRGVKVEEFGFGFPPRLFGIRRGETLYSLNLIPLGGFVKLFGEAEGGEPRSPVEPQTDNLTKSDFVRLDPRAFAARSLGERASIVVAGVVGNVFLAWFLFSLAHGIGVPTVGDDGDGTLRSGRVVITDVAAGSPASLNGLLPGDAIGRLEVGARALDPVVSVDAVQQFVNAHRGEELTLTVRRAGEERAIAVTPRVAPPAGEGALGIAMTYTGIRSYPWYEAFVRGAITTARFGWAIVSGFAMLVYALLAEGRVVADVAGPVGIAVLSHEATLLGFSYLVFFTALLSLNLAVINVLPLPALDGGRLLFLAIEWFKGSPVSQKAERVAHTAGFAFLMALMILVTYRDVLRFF